jgi:hypothetical protein
LQHFSNGFEILHKERDAEAFAFLLQTSVERCSFLDKEHRKLIHMNDIGMRALLYSECDPNQENNILTRAIERPLPCENMIKLLVQRKANPWHCTFRCENKSALYPLFISLKFTTMVAFACSTSVIPSNAIVEALGTSLLKTWTDFFEKLRTEIPIKINAVSSQETQKKYKLTYCNLLFYAAEWNISALQRELEKYNNTYFPDAVQKLLRQYYQHFTEALFPTLSTLLKEYLYMNITSDRSWKERCFSLQQNNNVLENELSLIKSQYFALQKELAHKEEGRLAIELAQEKIKYKKLQQANKELKENLQGACEALQDLLHKEEVQLQESKEERSRDVRANNQEQPRSSQETSTLRWLQ